MMLPSIFGDSFIDDFMNDDFMRFPSRQGKKMNFALKTDIKEVDGNYEISVDMPGYNKEDVSAKLDNGYLTISASHKEENDEKDDNGKYIRRERYVGEAKRSFFVGKDVRQEDMKAKFENGVLKLEFPKDTPKEVEEAKFIQIEG
ncbi:MAG: Hsp20/alpha crystallin family protein [Lachnospiraceae bacterium]|nr:Hsp20/alpha crystallin family protein [Lachnospiraceae bacterium]